jgi:hypothetical protein
MRTLSDTKTLLLNADYTPLKVRTWQQGVTLLYVKQTAIEVDFYSDMKIRDGHRAYPVPAVIVLKKYIRKNYMVKCSRRNVLIRDRMTCQYCNKVFSADKLNMDHIIPLSHWTSKENPTNFMNVVASCYTCNNKKGNKLGVNPIKPPHTPNRIELTLGINPFGEAPLEWKPYLEHYALFKELSYV